MSPTLNSRLLPVLLQAGVDPDEVLAGAAGWESCPRPTEPVSPDAMDVLRRDTPHLFSLRANAANEEGE